jgi:hypothetical protein
MNNIHLCRLNSNGQLETQFLIDAAINNGVLAADNFFKARLFTEPYERVLEAVSQLCIPSERYEEQFTENKGTILVTVHGGTTEEVLFLELPHDCPLKPILGKDWFILFAGSVERKQISRYNNGIEQTHIRRYYASHYSVSSSAFKARRIIEKYSLVCLPVYQSY